MSLILSLNFNYEIVPSKIGTLAFGLAGGELRMDLENIELSRFSITSDFQWWVDQNTEIGNSGSKSETHEGSAKLSANIKGPEAVASAGKKRTTEEASTSKVSTKSQVWQVHAIMGERPGWRFSAETGHPFLAANITDEEFAILNALKLGCQVALTFTTEQRFLRVENTDGYLFGQGEIDPRQKSLVGLYVWFRILKPRIFPNLSKVILSDTGVKDA